MQYSIEIFKFFVLFLHNVICSAGKSDEDGARSRSIQPQGTQVNEVTSSNPASEGVTSYLVASSPEVLSQILRENECRGVEFNPGLYMTPANALNITKVDFAPAGHPPPSPSTRLRGPRSLPGSTQSTLSRGGSLEKGRGMRRKTSLAASMTSGGVQVTHEGQY